MTVQRDATNITAKRFPIDIDLPSGWIRELAGIPQLPEPLLPDVKEVPEGDSNAIRDFNMDNSTVIVGVEPVEARPIRSNPNMCGDEGAFAIDVDAHMRMDVYATLLSVLTGDVVYRRVHHRLGRCLLLPHYQGDEADNHQHADCNETNSRDTPLPNGVPLFLFTPTRVFAAPFWP